MNLLKFVSKFFFLKMSKKYKLFVQNVEFKNIYKERINTKLVET